MARLAGWFTGMVAVGAFAVAEIPAQGDGGMPSRVPQDRPVPGLSWNEDIRYGQLLDSRDGHLYRVVKIGNRTWMAQNLNYSGMDKKLGSCGQGVDEDCIPCGRLYSWKEVMGEGADSTRRTVQGICPDGWRVPSDTEWTALQEHVEASGTFDGTRLKSQKGWKSGGGGSDL
ncbi:MAG: hypothetical protein RL318_3068, partial [Fibrobacterota bacterium]